MPASWKTLCAGVVVAALWTPAAVASQPGEPGFGGISPGTEFAGFEARVLTHPQAVLGTDGRRHLAYELVLTGTTPAALKVTRVQVRDAARRRVLLSLRGGRLTAHLTKLVDTEKPLKGGVVHGAETAVVWLDVPLPARGRVPARLDHVVTAVVQVKGAKGPTLGETLTPVRTLRRAVPVLGRPIGGGGTWYASDGCCTNYGHHRFGTLSINGALSVPQRFAIDFFALDALHRSWVGDPGLRTSYLSYRRPVIAVADGRVVSAVNTFPESTPPKPPKPPPIAETTGNNVILRLASGAYVLYGHMVPGTVRVRPGQRVKRGDVLGLIGTSGNSTTPHLHFQLLTTPTFFPTDSRPFVFDRFELVGQITRRIWDDDLGLQPTGKLPYAPAPRPGLRRDQMPLDRNVIVLPER